MNWIKKQRALLREHGLRGYIKKVGWKVALLLFLFFLAKGLVWLFIFFGGWELIKNNVN